MTAAALTARQAMPSAALRAAAPAADHLGRAPGSSCRVTSGLLRLG